MKDLSAALGIQIIHPICGRSFFFFTIEIIRLASRFKSLNLASQDFFLLWCFLIKSFGCCRAEAAYFCELCCVILCCVRRAV